MALQVWLPLNNDLKNQGLTKISIDNSGTTINSNGKIGQCFKVTSQKSLGYTPNFNNKGLSLCGWFKFNKSEINAITSTQTYDSKYKTSTGNLIGNNNYGGIGIIWETNNIYSSGSLVSINIKSVLRTSTLGSKITSYFNIEFDTWIHIALTWDPDTQVLSLYKDGMLFNSISNIGTFTDGVSRALYINYHAVYGGNARVPDIPIYENDIRIYDHCLSPKEVHEIAKGLVLHYPLDSNNISLSTNLITELRNGAQTSVSGKTINITGNNSDTYFYIKTSKTLTLNKQYKLSCIGTGFSNNAFYNFTIAAQSNTSPGIIKIQNGYCELIFIANEVIVNAGTTIIMDDYRRSPSAGTITNIVLQEYDDIIYDCSGYKNHGTITGNLTLNSDTPRYNYSSSFNGSTYISGHVLQGVAQTASFWLFVPSTVPSTGIVFLDRGSQLAFGYWSSGSTMIVACTNSCKCIYSTSYLTKNAWNHIVIIRPTGSSEPTLYVNGILRSNNGNRDCWGGSGSEFTIGTRVLTTPYPFTGKISDFRLYSTVLSIDDIKELYNTPTFIDNQGDLLTYEFDEHLNNMIDEENYGIIKKQWLRGLSKYTQQNCQCTLENDGYRIYRPANLTTSANGNTMWGGFVLDNANNRFGLVDGHTYIIEFEVKGKSSNAVTGVLWSNNVGWGGGGLIPAPTNVTMINPVVTNFNTSEWKYFSYRWTISDSVYKTCTSAYSSFIAGEIYVSYKHFKFGYGYSSTGELGTDIYIRNIRMYDITSNIEIMINKTGIVDSGSFIEDGIETQFFKDKIIKSTQLLEI